MLRYLMEALGLGIFMISIAVFGTLLLSPGLPFIHLVPSLTARIFLLSIFMAATAFFITTSPLTSPSGAHINPAVTISFLRLRRISTKDAFFYMLFQLVGATVSVYLMAGLLKNKFTKPPISYAVTLPGKWGMATAFFTELIISAGLMLLILFGNDNSKLKEKLPFYIALLICFYVNTTVQISGFSMNPARSFASAFPSAIWEYYWIYLSAPVAGMLLATEYYILKNKHYGKET